MHELSATAVAAVTNVSTLNSFRNRFNAAVCSKELYAGEGRASIAARFDRVRLGDIDVFCYEGQGIRGGMRDMRHIRVNPVDDFLLILPLRSSIEISQRQQHGVIRPGCFSFLSTRAPSEGRCGSPPNYDFSERIVRMPGTLLRHYLPQVDDICCLPINADTGAGRVMCSLIESLLSEGIALSQEQAHLFGPILLASIGAAAIDVGDASFSPCLQRGQTQERTRLAALSFIESNLSDPMLDTAKVAAHCHVSLRYLHAAFTTGPVAVGAFIREAHLEHCRAELRNPLLREKSILSIAMRWGFSGSASFTRAYKQRFGIPPSEERGKLGPAVLAPSLRGAKR